MASDVTVPNNFVTGTPSVADDVDANFTAITTWINTNAVHLDGSKPFTAVPEGPSGTDPTSANQLTRKAYVDAKADTRVGCTLRTVTAQTFPVSATTAVAWDTEVADTNGFYSGSGSATIPVGYAGLYAVSVTFYGIGGLSANSASVRPELAVSGTAATPIEFAVASAGSSTQRTLSIVLPLAEGVTVVPRMKNDSGSTAITSKCEMFLYRVSA